MRRIGSRSAEANRPSYYAIGQLGHYVIIVIGLVVAMQGVGINLSSLAVAAGAIGIGIGLGLQQAMNNFISGLILLFERSVKVGDFIELENGLQGTVREINMRSTVINTNDNLDVVVPNSLLTNGVLTNWTMSETSRRIHVPFGVAYGTNKELVRKAGLEAAGRVAKETHASGLRPPEVWLVGFGDSSLNFELVVWVGRESLSRPGRTRARYLWEIETSLGEHGIEIPFPQRDLHLRSGFDRLQAPKEA
jgi:small-conductance mechanosensitive channel